MILLIGFPPRCNRSVRYVSFPLNAKFIVDMLRGVTELCERPDCVVT